MSIRLTVGLAETKMEYDPAEDSWIHADDQLVIHPNEIMIEVRSVDGGCYVDRLISIEQLVKEAGYL
jgi:hypothetical protein